MEAAIKKFEKLVLAALPGCNISVDAPELPSGHWWVDLQAGKLRVAVEYRPKAGFGIHDTVGEFGEGPGEVYRTPELAARRIQQLLTARKGRKTRLTLKELRELCACSQADLAARVGVKQSAISRFEQRSEVKLGTLAAAVEALGGELQVRARFADADVPLFIKL